jgi:hypothetical protein
MSHPTIRLFTAWDKIGTKIISMRFISVHFGSLTVRLQLE